MKFESFRDSDLKNLRTVYSLGNKKDTNLFES